MNGSVPGRGRIVYYPFIAMIRRRKPPPRYRVTCPQVLVWTFVYFMLWLLMALALSVIMALYLQLEWGCPLFPVDSTSSETLTKCFTYNVDNSESVLLVREGIPRAEESKVIWRGVKSYLDSRKGKR